MSRCTNNFVRNMNIACDHVDPQGQINNAHYHHHHLHIKINHVKIYTDMLNMNIVCDRLNSMASFLSLGNLIYVMYCFFVTDMIQQLVCHLGNIR